MPTRLASAVADGVMGDDSMITPEGFGFSAPARRILKEAGRSDGFYKAKGKELVIDVMEAITSEAGQEDVALVYGDDGELTGLFTETDYIKVRYRTGDSTFGDDLVVVGFASGRRNCLFLTIESFVRVTSILTCSFALLRC